MQKQHSIPTASSMMSEPIHADVHDTFSSCLFAPCLSKFIFKDQKYLLFSCNKCLGNWQKVMEGSESTEKEGIWKKLKAKLIYPWEGYSREGSCSILGCLWPHNHDNLLHCFWTALVTSLGIFPFFWLTSNGQQFEVTSVYTMPENNKLLMDSEILSCCISF